MSIVSQSVRYGNGREYEGFCAWLSRAAAPLPAVLVIQEVWGLDEHIKDVTLRFAKAGYVAFAPDLYSVHGERPAATSAPRMEAVKEFADSLPAGAWLDPKARLEAVAKLPEPRRSEVSEFLGTLYPSLAGKMGFFVSMLVEAAVYLRLEHPLSRGAKVGSVGFCLGGGLSARLACADPNLAAAVIYYGAAPPTEEIGRIACPVLGLYGGLDARVNAGLADFASEMQMRGKRFEHQVYEGAMHAFFNDTRRSYHASASRDAFARTLEFFRREL